MGLGRVAMVRDFLRGALTDALFMATAIDNTGILSLLEAQDTLYIYICSHTLRCPFLFLFLREFVKSPRTIERENWSRKCDDLSEVAVVGIRLHGARCELRSFFPWGIRFAVSEYVDRQGRDDVMPRRSQSLSRAMPKTSRWQTPRI